MPSASGEKPFWLLVILNLQLVNHSPGLDKPYLTGGCGAMSQRPEVWLHLSSEEDLVWSFLKRLKGSVCS